MSQCRNCSQWKAPRREGALQEVGECERLALSPLMSAYGEDDTGPIASTTFETNGDFGCSLFDPAPEWHKPPIEALLVEKVRENRDKVERVLGPGTKELYRKAIAKWGESLEIDCVIEEMAELTAELVRHRRGRGRAAMVAEEIADVRIMLDQLEMIYDCEAQVEDWRTKKLLRLVARVAAP